VETYGPVEIRIYNVTGQTVRRLIQTVPGTGRYTADWDGKDDRGEAAASGLYLVAVLKNNKAEIKKVLVLKK
jgi:flagellar hook assembly protein FlgD